MTKQLITILIGFFIPNLFFLFLIGKFIIKELKNERKGIIGRKNNYYNNPFSEINEKDLIRDFLMDRGFGKIIKHLAVIAAVTLGGIVFNLFSRIPIDDITNFVSINLSNLIIGLIITFIFVYIGYKSTHLIIGRIIEEDKKGLIGDSQNINLKIESLILFIISVVFALLCLPFLAEFNLKWNNTKLILSSSSFGILIYLLPFFKLSEFKKNEKENNKENEFTNLDF